MTKTVSIGKVKIGGDNPIAIQSMTNTRTRDIDATVAQIEALSAAGCDIVRCSVPDTASAEALKSICARSPLPVVADIHFDYKLAMFAADSGAAKIRINPGNIGGQDKVNYLASYLKERSIPIRIGVNGGSLDSKYKALPLDKAMCESALEHVSLLEKAGFYDIVISVKSSDVAATVSCNRLLSAACDYPLHLGVTEAGLYTAGLVKSAIGIGALLMEGIGDTIRVSLTDNPVQEVYAAKEILKAINRYDKPYVEVISCPTCARTEIDVKGLAERIRDRLSDTKRNIKIAVMGCVVNGIGESSHCDIGVAGGKHKSAIFKDGKIIETVDNVAIEDRLLQLIDEYGL